MRAHVGLNAAPWLVSPLGPFRNTVYRRRQLGLFTGTGLMIFVGAFLAVGVGAPAFFRGIWIDSLALIVGGVFLWILVRLPPFSLGTPQSVTFRQNGIELRHDSPFGSVIREVAYFDVIPQPLKADGSLIFQARNTYVTRSSEQTGQSIPATIRLRPADARKVSGVLPGFYPWALVPIVLWAKRIGMGVQPGVLDTDTDPRAVLMLQPRGKGWIFVEGDSDEIRVSVRIDFVQPPRAPNAFAALPPKAREELGAFLKVAVQALGPTTNRFKPEQFVDIEEVKFVELSRSLTVRREDPGSFQLLAESLDALDADARRVVTELREKWKTVEKASTAPPSEIYG
jgi:hypothetical protein